MAINAQSLGSNNGGVDRKEIFLKVFIGEVVTAFETSNIGMNLIKIKTLNSGKSAQFIATGSFSHTDVSDHTPGDLINTTNMLQQEVTIDINDRHYISNFYDKFEEKLQTTDLRSEISKQMGLSISAKTDIRIFTELETAFNTATGLAGRSGGSTITNTVIASGATAKDKGNAIIDAMFEANTALNLRDVTGERYFVTTFTNYANLVQSDIGVNKDFTNGNGGIDSGIVGEIAGVKILATNNLPTTLGLEGIMFTEAAVAMVKFMDLKTEANYDFNRLGDIVTSQMAYGMGVLDPSCAVGVLSA